MVRVALTGGIATGKTHVRRLIDARGIPTIDADQLAREALGKGSPGAAAVAARFGDGVLTSDGTIDRRALAALVFADPAARRALESIVHPAVYAAIESWFAALPRSSVAIADIPLLFETGRQEHFDHVIVVACPVEEQVRRVMARDGVTEADARARIAAQWPIEDKVRQADDVIWTSGSYEETETQVDKVLEGLRREAARRIQVQPDQT